MEQIPEKLRDKIPKLYETEEQQNPIVYAKLFLDSWTWYITELSIDNDICFGLVVSPFCTNGELGYFSLHEIKNVKGSLGLSVERDLHFTPTSLSEIKKGL
jgi:hypothetical protein